MKIVKPDALTFNAYFADSSIHGYYSVSDCVEVDIDELSEEWQRDFVNLMGLGNGQVYMQPTKSFSEFLQERMK